MSIVLDWLVEVLQSYLAQNIIMGIKKNLSVKEKFWSIIFLGSINIPCPVYFQKVLSPKKLWVKNILDPKKILVQKTLDTKKSMSEKYFGSKTKILAQTHFEKQKEILSLKNIGSEKI